MKKISICPDDLQIEIKFLSGYDQSIGLDIRNMLDIAESKLNKLTTVTDPDDKAHDAILNEVFPIITMIRQVRNLNNDMLFLSIDSLIYKLHEHGC